MSLSARDWQALSSIEDEVAESDPRLASLFNDFAKKTAGQEMSTPERGPAAWRRLTSGPSRWRGRVTRAHHIPGPSWLPSMLVVCLLLICTAVGAVVASHIDTHGACATAMPTQARCPLRTPSPR